MTIQRAVHVKIAAGETNVEVMADGLGLKVKQVRGAIDRLRLVGVPIENTDWYTFAISSRLRLVA